MHLINKSSSVSSCSNECLLHNDSQGLFSREIHYEVPCVCHPFLKCLLLCFIYNAVRSPLSFAVCILTAFIKIETWARTKIDTGIFIPYFILLSVGHSYEWLQGMMGSGWPHPTGIHQAVIDSLERTKALQISSAALHSSFCSLSSWESRVFLSCIHTTFKISVYRLMSR